MGETQSYAQVGDHGTGWSREGFLHLSVPFPISSLCLHPSGSGVQGEARVQMAMVAACTYARTSEALPTVAATQVTSLLQTARPVKVGCFA